jgi:hypothetical protein
MKTCANCGSANLNYTATAIKCQQCGHEHPRITLADELDRTIARVLAEADDLCLDAPDDRDALRGLLLAALLPEKGG